MSGGLFGEAALLHHACRKVGHYVIPGVRVPRESVEHAYGQSNERVLVLGDLLPCRRAIGENAGDLRDIAIVAELDDDLPGHFARHVTIIHRTSAGSIRRSAADERASSCEDVRVELGMLHEIAAERRVRWEAAGIGWEIADGPLTDKPASWLILTGDTGIGQLTVWVSGEAEMDWGPPNNGGGRHYDLDSREALSACVTDLEGALGLK